jgi:hypothetical protein
MAVNEVPQEDSQAAYEREVFRQIRLPMLSACGFLAFVVLSLALFAITGQVSGRQTSTLSNILLILLVFLPAVMLMLVFNFLMLLSLFSLWDAHLQLKAPLDKAQGYAQQGAEFTQKVSAQLSEPLITVQGQAAFLAAIWEP